LERGLLYRLIKQSKQGVLNDRQYHASQKIFESFIGSRQQTAMAGKSGRAE
jgi:hypothetical protein